MCDHEVLIADTKTGCIQYRLQNPAEYFGDPTWSPSARLAAVCCQKSGRVVLLDSQGLEVRSIAIGTDARLISAAFSPDSSLIAVIDSKSVQLCRVESGEVIYHKALDLPGSSSFSITKAANCHTLTSLAASPWSILVRSR